MRIVALQAIPNRWAVHFPFNFGGLLVCMAGEAQRIRGGSDEFYAGYVSVDPNFVATETAARNCCVNRFAFGLVGMALDAFGPVDLGIEGGVFGGAKPGSRDRQHKGERQDRFQGCGFSARGLTGIGGSRRADLRRPNCPCEQSGTPHRLGTFCPSNS